MKNEKPQGYYDEIELTSSGNWLCSSLYMDEVSHLTDKIQLLKIDIQDKETIDRLKKYGGCIEIVYWNPADTISFDVNGDDLF